MDEFKPLDTTAKLLASADARSDMGDRLAELSTKTRRPDRYRLVHGTFSAGGGYLIADGARQERWHLDGPDGREWRTPSRTQAEEVIVLANQADREGLAFVLPQPMTPLEQEARGRNPLSGPFRSTAGARMVTIPKVSDRAPIREYLVRCVIVDMVDGAGRTCAYCSERYVSCNIYITPLEHGVDDYAETCVDCSLNVVDTVLDTDPAHVVTIERLA